jgi:hypothetical protein
MIDDQLIFTLHNIPYFDYTIDFEPQHRHGPAPKKI